jgi:CubicO group peptidase (beta-lactamase class C family)
LKTKGAIEVKQFWFLALGVFMALGAWLSASTAAGPFAWQRYKNPEDAGFSREAIRRIENHYARSGLASLFIVHHGRVVLALGDYQRRLQCHSIRKSLMNAVLGIGVDENRIDLDKTLEDLGIDDQGGLTADEKQATVRQLLQARSGVYHAAVYETGSMSRTRPKRGAHPPGSFWYYNNWDFNVLSTIVNQKTGDDFLRLFNARVAGPLGMEDYREFDGNYFSDPAVSRHPAYGFKLSARDLARFGQLYLQKGIWNGKRILSREWIEESTKPYSVTHTARGGYGYLWWIPDLGNSLRAFAACGVGTQVLLVVPDLDLVIVQRVNTFAGKNHPFDMPLYQMIVRAKKGAGKEAPTCIPLPTLQENPNYEIKDKENFVGNYLSTDGEYEVRPHGNGLLIRYPKGMQALLLPWKNNGTFLVEDIFEIISLEKTQPGKTGKLNVLGNLK